MIVFNPEDVFASQVFLISDLDAFVKAMQANQKDKDDKKDEEEKMEH